MESRERVFRALKHQQPDRVPRDFWATAETYGKLCRRLKLALCLIKWDNNEDIITTKCIWFFGRSAN